MTCIEPWVTLQLPTLVIHLDAVYFSVIEHMQSENKLTLTNLNETRQSLESVITKPNQINPANYHCHLFRK